MARRRLGGVQEVLEAQNDRQDHDDAGRHRDGVVERPLRRLHAAHRRGCELKGHGFGGAFARTVATAATVVTGALLPQLVRSWLTTAAISTSESCCPHAGI